MCQYLNFQSLLSATVNSLTCTCRYISVYKQGNNKYFTMQQTEQIHYKFSLTKTHKHEILLDSMGLEQTEAASNYGHWGQ